MTALLTIGRRAVWEAIDTYPQLEGRFRLKLRGEADGDVYSQREALSLPDAPTALSQLPAIQVAPATSELEWINNQLQQSEFAVAITIWTAGWGWSLSEELWEHTYGAVMLNKPPDSPRATYLSRPVTQGGTGHYPRVLPSRFSRLRLGTADNEADRPKVLNHTFGVALKLNIQGVA